VSVQNAAGKMSKQMAEMQRRYPVLSAGKALDDLLLSSYIQLCLLLSLSLSCPLFVLLSVAE
jgi:hypothetical protein